MNLLQVNPEQMHRAEPSAEARTIKVFSDIIRRDRGSKGDHDGRYKQQATKELAWIYHMADFRSPYFNLIEEERLPTLNSDLFDDEGWTPDELVEQGLQTYKKLIRTPSMNLLEAAQESVGKLEKYLRNINFDEMDEKGALKYSPKELVGNLEKLGKVVDSISELRKRVEKEQLQDGEAWGGVELNEFNR